MIKSSQKLAASKLRKKDGVGKKWEGCSRWGEEWHRKMSVIYLGNVDFEGVGGSVEIKEKDVLKFHRAEPGFGKSDSK